METANGNKMGKVIQVMGPVVDVEFKEGGLPPIYTALKLTNPLINDQQWNLVVEVAQQLAQRAREKGCTLPQLALAWILHQPGITGAIIGPRTLAHFNDLLEAAGVQLEPSDLKYCDVLVPPGMSVSDHFNTSRWKPE